MFGFIKNTKDSIDFNNIGDNDCRKIVGSLYTKGTNNIVDKNVYRELEMFEDNKGGDNTVFSRINLTETFFGCVYLKNILMEPKTGYIKMDRPEKGFVQNANKSLLYIKKHQKCIVSFMKPLDPIYDNIYIPGIVLKTLNNEELRIIVQKYYMVFNISLPFYTIFSPIVFLVMFYILRKILPNYFIDKMRYLINLSMMGLMEINIFKIDSFYSLARTVFSLFFFVYNIYSSIKFSLISYILYDKIKEKLEILKGVTEKVYSLFKINNLGIKTLQKIDIETGEWFNYGYMMIKYKKFIKNSSLVEYIKYIGELDYILCKEKLIDKGYTVSNFIDSQKPIIVLKGFSNPYFSDRFVKNDITVSDNIIITGVNAGGKSTVIKSVLLNILLSQTLGISCSDYMLMTPFSYITSSFNTFDEKGKLSLFQKEISRMDQYIDNIKKLGNSRFGFIAIDEIFSGTNQHDAEMSADIYCDKLSILENNLALVTTHLTDITKKRDHFKNYKMVIKRIDNKLVYTYKLEEGINKESVIFDLLVKVI